MYAVIIVGSFFLFSESSNDPKIDISIENNLFFSDQYLLRDRSAEELVDVETIIYHILDIYTQAGFPFCQVFPKIESVARGEERIILQIEEGPRVKITDYIFRTDGKTMPSVLKKIAGTKSDGYFSSTEIERMKRKIKKTDVFSRITEIIVQRNDAYYLLFDLQEKNSDFISALGSVAEGQYFFTVSFHSLNMLGTMRKLKAIYEYKKRLFLGFTEPILLFPTQISGEFSLWTFDSVRLMELKGEISTPLGEYFSVSLMSGLEHFTYFGTNQSTDNYVNNVIGIGLMSSYYTEWWSEQQSLNIEYLFRHQDRWKIQFDGSLLFHGLNVRPHYYLVKSDSILYFDYFRVGGARTMRGYFEDEFWTEKAFWINLEFKKYIVFPLFDYGLIDGNSVYSYGFGIESHSNFAYTSLTFAWPEHGSWREGKIHLLFEKGF